LRNELHIGPIGYGQGEIRTDPFSTLRTPAPDTLRIERTATPTQEVLRIKKLPPELRRRRANFRSEPRFLKRLLWRLKEDSQFLRLTTQLAFVLLCVWIGLEFYLFVRWGTSGGTAAYVTRPPGSEGFLPISALISLKYWIQTGIINQIHPAGLFIFVAILALGVLLKKAFCSWLCPVGTLSESLWMLGKKMFGRNFKAPAWLDYPLRSLKYLLAFFFVYSISQMDVPSLETFIGSPYNKVAEIKMYLFFAHISSFALWTIIILMLLSVFIRNFWCRFLCPYGALLGALSWLSPVKITRNKSTCIDCELCTKACPAEIKVHEAGKRREGSPIGRVWSDECSACLQCVEACPVIDTLNLRTVRSNASVPPWVFGALVAGVFVAITGLAVLTGSWQNGISREEYLKRFKEINSPLYQHFQGRVPEYGPND
jgi:polyferredoxin